MNFRQLVLRSILKEFPAFVLSYLHRWSHRSYSVILMYHSINNYCKHRLVVRPEIFDNQLAYLRDNDWQIVTLSEVMDGNSLGEQDLQNFHKRVILSFDDGYEDNYYVLFNILKKYQATAIIFLIADFLGTDRVFPWFSSRNGWAVSMNIHQIEEMQSSGIQFGAHTMTHTLLSSIRSDHVLYNEIIGSKKYLEQQIGAINYFCYPAGDYTSKAVDLVEKGGYHGALSVIPGFINSPKTNPYLLPRIEISGFDDTIELFHRKITGCYIPFHRLIQMWQKSRYYI